MGFGLPLAPQAYLAALVNLLGAAFSLPLVPDRLPQANPRPFLATVAAPWRDRDFLLVYLTRFLVMLGFYLAQTYLQYFLADVVRVFAALGRVLTEEPFQAVALLGLLISLGAALASVPAGKASDRLGRKPLIYLSGAGLGLLMPFILLFPTMRRSFFSPSFSASSTGCTWRWTGLGGRCPQGPRGPRHGHGPLADLHRGAPGAGRGLWPPFGPPDAREPGLGYGVLFLLGGICFLLGAFLVAGIRRAR